MWNWLTWSDTGQLQNLLAPYPAEEMQAVRVGSMVSNPNVDVPGLISPIQDEFDKNP
jgi:putative SOS response-associated peptidase YedK